MQKYLFNCYKKQGKVEKGFRFLKDKQFMASTIFVKKPERVEVVLMIMTLSLLVYASLEYELRQALVEQKITLPNQNKKEVQNVTMRWVFALFTGIHVLYTNEQNTYKILNIKPLHQKIIQLLNQNIKYYYKTE